MFSEIRKNIGDNKLLDVLLTFKKNKFKSVLLFLATVFSKVYNKFSKYLLGGWNDVNEFKTNFFRGI